MIISCICFKTTFDFNIQHRNVDKCSQIFFDPFYKRTVRTVFELNTLSCSACVANNPDRVHSCLIPFSVPCDTANVVSFFSIWGLHLTAIKPQPPKKTLYIPYQSGSSPIPPDYGAILKICLFALGCTRLTTQKQTFRDAIWVVLLLYTLHYKAVLFFATKSCMRFDSGKSKYSQRYIQIWEDSQF